jgi:hypothetical protein
MRRSLRYCLAVGAAVAALPVVTAVPAQAATPTIGLVVPILAPMLPGQQGWVSALWGTTGDICDVRATASGVGLSVTYPSNTNSYASLYKQDSLSAGHFDYTAFKLDVDDALKLGTALNIKLTYTEKSGSGSTCTGTTRTVNTSAILPIVASTGAAVVQKTSTVTVPQATPVWTQLSFQGRKAGLENFRVTLDAPSGLSVAYPGDKTSTGLSAGTALPIGSDDFVAVRVDATGAKAGTYKVPVHATYTGGSFDDTLTVVVA